nr:MAG TPA: hypothetical protein [Caudoviricetes sp.]
MSDTYRSRVYTDRPPYADFDAPAKFQAIESIIAKRLTQHPNAQVESGVLQICPRSVMGPNGWRKDGCGGVLCETCRREFWMQEVE